MDSFFFELLAITLLILVNGFFSCAEFAIISIRKSRISQLVEEGEERARIVEELQREPQRVLALVQIGVTVVGSTASALAGVLAVEELEPVFLSSSLEFVRNGAEPFAVTLVVAVVSYLSLILGELVPKTIGLQYADPVALQVARPIRFLARIGSVLVSTLNLSTRGVLALLRIKAGDGAFISREEVQHIVAEGREIGVFSATEHEYIQNIFDFTHTCVREVMVPRMRIVALDLNHSREALLELVLENKYSRYPVFREDIENIVGFIHSKDLLGNMVADPECPIDGIIRPPFYVPEGKKVNDLLKEMQRQRIHMAFVVDEYGGISGLVTTEDLLEELVGEIEDEHDVGEPLSVQKCADGSLMVDALISLSDLEDALEIRLEDDLPFDTLAGLILDQLGRFPEQGEQISWRGYLFTCEQVRATAIERVRISRLDGESAG